MGTEFWSSERIDLLTKMAAEGASGLEIALALCTTRNAVIGKIRRRRIPWNYVGAKQAQLRLQTREQRRERKVRPPYRKQRAAPARRVERQGPRFEVAKSVRPPPPRDQDIPAAQRIPLLRLTNHTCRWPVGDPHTPDFFYCGAVEADWAAGIPYCRHHMERAHVRPQQENERERQATRGTDESPANRAEEVRC